MTGNHQYTVLCIDDNEADRDILRRYLTKDTKKQYLIHEAATADEGYEKIDTVKPDCVLVDYRLQNCTGLEFIQTLIKNRPNCPAIIMLTGQGNEAVAAAAMSMGVLDYIIKSQITATGLLRAINNAVEKWSLIEKIKEQNKYLLKANGLLEAMNQEILRSYQVLSHELRTPLTSTFEFLAILSDQIVGPINAEQTKLIEFALENCGLMKLYINDLLEASLLDAGKMVLHMQVTSVSKILETAIATIKPAARNKNITLSAVLHGNLPDLRVDEKRILQVIMNLMTNAIKFTPEGGRIDLRAEIDRQQSKFIRISVTDTGIGIKPKQFHKIFDRFYQIKKLKTDNIEGLGLGLCICKQLVNLHGGEISVNSILLKGSTFTFTIPTVLVLQESNLT